jgi:hypothetical protein
MYPVDIANVPQPVLEQPEILSLGCSTHRTAIVVP